MSVEQIMAILIFGAMFVIIAIGKYHRAWVALGGAALTAILIFHIEPIKIYSAVNWQTIIFIFGMMVMVEGLAISGFFRWMCLLVAKIVRYHIAVLFVAFFFLSGFLSMFIDSITVLLFMSSITIEIARNLKIDPIPFIISEIAAANTGGSATMCGDPPNIIIATSFNFGFLDFIINTGPIAWIVMLVLLGYFFLVYHKYFRSTSTSAEARKNCPQPAEAILNPRMFKMQSAVFLIVAILLTTHQISHLSVATIGIIAAVLTIISCAISSVGRSIMNLLLRIDWKTLLFFLGLFITVGGLEQSGLLKLLANLIITTSNGNVVVVMSMILWMSGFASAIVDNIPFVSIMVPVLRELSIPGLSLSAMSWTLALGADIGGNATPIGASANVVGTAIAEKEGYPISWGRFCKVSVPGMILSVAVCWLLLIVRYT